jgi:hypothetical protein
MLMKYVAMLALIAVAPFAALAEQPAPATPAPAVTAPSVPQPASAAPTTPAPEAPDAAAAAAASLYAVPVERLRVTGADAKLLEQGAAAGGYSTLYRGLRSGMRIVASTRSRYRANFRFTDAAGTDLITGMCQTRTEGNSAFGVRWNQRTSQLYSCEIKDKPADRFGLEVIVPAFKEGGFSIGGLTVGVSGDIPDAELQAVLKARMVFDGITYEATPTEFARNPYWDRRVVQGFTITRDGALVGRIDFGNDNTFNRGHITAPTSEADGKQAVQFFAQQLYIMPDLYSSTVRAELNQ